MNEIASFPTGIAPVSLLDDSGEQLVALNDRLAVDLDERNASQRLRADKKFRSHRPNVPARFAIAHRGIAQSSLHHCISLISSLPEATQA